MSHYAHGNTILNPDGDLTQFPIDDLIALRDAWREGRVRLLVTDDEKAEHPDVQAWIASCEQKVRAAIETEIARRMN